MKNLRCIIKTESLKSLHLQKSLEWSLAPMSTIVELFHSPLSPYGGCVMQQY